MNCKNEKLTKNIAKSILPCDKPFCNLYELHQICEGVIKLIDSDEKMVFLSCSRRVKNIQLCLWRQDKTNPGKVNLIVRLQGFIPIVKQLMPFLEEK